MCKIWRMEHEKLFDCRRRIDQEEWWSNFDWTANSPLWILNLKNWKQIEYWNSQLLKRSLLKNVLNRYGKVWKWQKVLWMEWWLNEWRFEKKTQDPEDKKISQIIRRMNMKNRMETRRNVSLIELQTPMWNYEPWNWTIEKIDYWNFPRRLPKKCLEIWRCEPDLLNGYPMRRPTMMTKRILKNLNRLWPISTQRRPPITTNNTNGLYPRMVGYFWRPPVCS